MPSLDLHIAPKAGGSTRDLDKRSIGDLKFYLLQLRNELSSILQTCGHDQVFSNLNSTSLKLTPDVTGPTSRFEAVHLAFLSCAAVT